MMILEYCQGSVSLVWHLPTLSAAITVFHVDAFIRYSKEVHRLSDEDLGSEVVFWLIAHVHVHSLLPIPIRRNRAILVDHFDVLQDV